MGEIFLKIFPENIGSQRSWSHISFVMQLKMWNSMFSSQNVPDADADEEEESYVTNEGGDEIKYFISEKTLLYQIWNYG